MDLIHTADLAMQFIGILPMLLSVLFYHFAKNENLPLETFTLKIPGNYPLVYMVMNDGQFWSTNHIIYLYKGTKI